MEKVSEEYRKKVKMVELIGVVGEEENGNDEDEND